MRAKLESTIISEIESELTILGRRSKTLVARTHTHIYTHKNTFITCSNYMSKINIQLLIL